MISMFKENICLIFRYIMVFRRPRVNVKPNVQATRPVSSIVRPTDASEESISTQSQEEQSSQQIDPPTAPPIIEGINSVTKFYIIPTHKN